MHTIEEAKGLFCPLGGIMEMICAVALVGASANAIEAEVDPGTTNKCKTDKCAWWVVTQVANVTTCTSSWTAVERPAKGRCGVVNP